MAYWTIVLLLSLGGAVLAGALHNPPGVRISAVLGLVAALNIGRNLRDRWRN